MVVTRVFLREEANDVTIGASDTFLQVFCEAPQVSLVYYCGHLTLITAHTAIIHVPNLTIKLSSLRR